MMTLKRISLIVLVTVIAGSNLPARDPDLTREVGLRRQAVMEKMDNRGMLILFSGEQRPYSGDVSYEFRQENNLFYLTGIRQHGITLVLMPQNSAYREILFLPARNPHAELWNGKMLSSEEASGISGIDNVWPASEFESFIDTVLYGRPYRLNRYLGSSEYKDFFNDLERDKAETYLLLETKPGLKGEMSKEFQFSRRLQERFPGVRVKDVSKILNQRRVVKSEFEVQQVQKAIDITTEAHLEAMRILRPGVWEYEVEATIEYVFKKRNSFDWAFPSIVASGPKATILHYNASQRQTRDGELILIDIGAEVNYYAADVTRTFPVNGKFTPEQAEIYQLVLDAQKASMASVKPGSSLARIHREAVDVLKEGLLRLNLITDKHSNQYRAFFPHGVGHFLGLDVHDVRHGERLEAGMILTVEPGIYVRDDILSRFKSMGTNEAALERIARAIGKYMNIGVRIEDDVLVTDNGHELLSKKLPREIAEIEALMNTRVKK